MTRPVYLDNNATTPLDPRAFEAMRPFFCEEFGNAMSSQHAFGWTAKAAVEKARAQCARSIGAEPREITFTSGATESIHLAVLGALEAAGDQPLRILTTAVEHKCVLEVFGRAAKLGHAAEILPVNGFGQLEIQALERALDAGAAALVSVVHANNEIGSINDIAAIGALCSARGALLHVDAAQSLGKIPIDVRAMKIDLLSASAHKIYGPKGAGFLFVRQTAPRARVAPYIVGGGQEKGLRGGTHNVPAIVGFGAACELAMSEIAEESARLTKLRDRLIDGVLKAARAAGVEAELNGHLTERLPNSVSVTACGVAPDEFLLATSSEIAYSSASACSSGSGGQSHVLAAIGRKDDPFAVTIRLGLGRFTTDADVDRALACLRSAFVKAARALAPARAAR